MLKPTIFREYDIRGIVGKDFDTQDAEIVGKAFGTVIQEISDGNIIVGHDNRFTSDEITAYFLEGLLSTGCQVTDVQLAIRPAIQTAIFKESFSGGTLITGSHNPSNYNGFKFFTSEGLPLFGENIKKLKELCFSKKFKKAPQGKVSYKDLKKLYHRHILSKFTIEKELTVVIDCGNGTTAKFAPELFRKLGLNVECLYCNLHGKFPNHVPDPAARVNTLTLSEKVQELDADLGLAFDTDGDRFGVIDETGTAHENDRTVALLAKDILKRSPGSKILFDIKSSQILKTEIEKAGGIPIMMRTGHPFFQDRMKKDPQILLGGELSGHTMYRDNNCFDDGLYAAAKLVEIVAQAVQPASKLYKALPQTHHTPEIKAPCPDEEKFNIVEEIQDHYRSNYPIFEDDGIRINFTDNAWGLIRASHTTPALSLRFEADKKDKLEKIMRNVKKELEKHPQVDLGQLELFL